MKTKEQIEMAQDIIKGLQDYIELSKAVKKLKINSIKDNVDQLVETIVSVAKVNVNSL